MAASTLRLLIDCPDQPGIIAAVTSFVHTHRGNILELDQHTDTDEGEFFMRLEVDVATFALTQATFETQWRALADGFKMNWRACWGNQKKRMAIFVSRESHCLSDLLWRCREGEFEVDLAFVAGNHETLRPLAESLGVRFYHHPVTPETKPAQEADLRGRLDGEGVEFIVLARYMQILSPEFVDRYPARIINIHHSFLPAFAGPRPYHQAFTRGVKIIGATSHYVTEKLDDGPIIAQATTPIDHRDTVQDLIRKGRDLERVVLATAVRQHIDDRILLCGNRTVVFD